MFVYVMSYADREEETTPMFVGGSIHKCYNYIRHYDYRAYPEDVEIRCNQLDKKDADMPGWCESAYYLTATSEKYGVCKYLVKKMVFDQCGYGI